MDTHLHPRAQDCTADGSDGSDGSGHGPYRRPDTRIAQVIAEALDGARTVVNVGAGTGSYEHAARLVTAVEPSRSLRARRPARLPRAVDAVPENLPFADDEFDGAMTLFGVHQWSDASAGLRELRRVTRGPVVILTCDPERVREFWLHAYAPEVLDAEARRYPPLEDMAKALGGNGSMQTVPIPLDCTDGFNEAYYGRPEPPRPRRPPGLLGVELRRRRDPRTLRRDAAPRPGVRGLGRTPRPPAHAADVRGLARHRARDPVTPSRDLYPPGAVPCARLNAAAKANSEV
ncbi:class I SAM-dependent methyltransferase [Streptomyces xanthophaeus]